MSTNDKSLGCCPQPSCPDVTVFFETPTISLLCDSIGASKTKCGYAEFISPSTPPKRYLQKVSTDDSNWSRSQSVNCPPVNTITSSFDYSYTTTTIFDPTDCSSDTINSGSGTASLNNPCDPNPCMGVSTSWSGAPPIEHGSPSSCFIRIDASCITLAFLCDGPALTTVTTPTTIVRAGSDLGYSKTLTETLSEEYTTSALIDNTIAGLPAYDDDFNDSCAAIRNLPANELSYTIQRFKYKFKTKQTWLGYVKISWNETFKPTLSSGLEDSDPTHWSVTAKEWEWSAGSGDPSIDLYSDVFELIEPAINGTVYVTDIHHGGFKYNFRFDASPSCEMKIFWNEVFKPKLASGITYCGSGYSTGSIDPRPASWTKTTKTYTWATSDNPCGPENPEGVPIHPPGNNTDFDSSSFTAVVPPNGQFALTDIRWSILTGNNDTDSYNPTASSIEGIDTYAGNSTSYLCNSRTAAAQNCVPHL